MQSASHSERAAILLAGCTDFVINRHPCAQQQYGLLSFSRAKTPWLRAPHRHSDPSTCAPPLAKPLLRLCAVLNAYEARRKGLGPRRNIGDASPAKGKRLD
jgi:hypothetical protein